MNHPIIRRSTRAVLVPASILCFFLVSIPAGFAVELERPNENMCFVTGDTYRCQLLSKILSPSFELRVGSNHVRALEALQFIVWGEPWLRRLEANNLSGVKSQVAAGQNEVVATISGQNEFFNYEASYRFHADAIDLEYRCETRKDPGKLVRVSLEINPAWRSAAGHPLALQPLEGEQREQILPNKGTPAGRYETITSEDLKGATLNDLAGAGGGSWTLTGPFRASFEQTGKQFRWHAGMTAGDMPVRPAPGTRFALKLRLAFAAAMPVEDKSKPLTLSVDTLKPGVRISPGVFGAQVGRLGQGIETKNTFHPWQFNPAKDEISRAFYRESGVSWVRIYLHDLYDAYGACGSDLSKGDPISPAEGAPCDYSRGDSALEAFKALGIDVMLCVGLWCPPWLSSQRPSPKYNGLWMIHRAPPKDNAKWAALIAGLVRHVNLEKKLGMRSWQVGNEPNDPVRYWVGGTMAEFIEYFKTASAAMKAVDPTLKISGPDLSDLYAKAWPENLLSWRDEFIRACHPAFDDFSFNCYRANDFTAHLRDLRQSLANAGVQGKTLTIAEYNLTAGDFDNAGIFNFDGALYVAQALRSAMENGLDRADHYDWGAGSLGFFNRMGDRLEPRPSYHAFRMHAALGRLKNGTWLPAGIDSEDVTVVAAAHEDGKGLSIIAAADNPFALKLGLRLSLGGSSGKYRIQEIQLVPGATNLTERNLEDISASTHVSVPGRSLTLWVLRR